MGSGSACMERTGTSRSCPSQQGEASLTDVRIGVIGAGAMGSLHVRLLASDVRGAQLVAVADIERERAAQLAREVGVRAIGDGCELIASPDVDAVVVASSPQTHEDLVRACLEAGKRVLCEKPLATSAAASRRI